MARRDDWHPRRIAGRRQRTPKRSVLIVTNGIRTEAAYLAELKRRVDHKVIAVTNLSMNGEPETLIRRLRRPNGNTSAYDEVWLVVDEDGADRSSIIAECAGLTTKSQRWIAVISRPCFESWLIAHYEPVRRYADQAEAARHFRKLGSPTRNKKELPSDFPIDAMREAVDRTTLAGDELGGPNTLPPSPGSAMPHLLQALGLL